MGSVLHVCTTCKRQADTGGRASCDACPLVTGQPGPAACDACRTLPDGQVERVRPGALLHRALAALALPDGVTLLPVECLSACTQGCSVALSGKGKWSYVYGRLSADNAADILAGAAAHAASPDGLVPWRERPEIFRKQSLARIPPQE